MTIRHARFASELGELLVVGDDEALHGVYFPHHWTMPAEHTFGEQVHVVDHPVLCHAASQIEEFLAGERTTFTVPTRTAGDAFREHVWARLGEVPYGATTTYGELADSLDEEHRAPMVDGRSLAQRVGTAVGHNPLSIMVPCHRVIGADGSLKGYAGGVRRKRHLLDLEARVAAGRAA